MIGEPAPGFMLETIRGYTVSLAKLRGQFVVIHFAATW
jgi:peroxiredoxin